MPVGTRFSALQTGPGALPASSKMGNGSFPGVKCGRGVLLTTHTLLVPRSWKSRAIPLHTLWGHTGPVTGSLYLTFTVSSTDKRKTHTHTHIHLYLCFTKQHIMMYYWINLNTEPTNKTTKLTTSNSTDHFFKFRIQGHFQMFFTHPNAEAYIVSYVINQWFSVKYPKWAAKLSMWFCQNHIRKDHTNLQSCRT